MAGSDGSTAPGSSPARAGLEPGAVDPSDPAMIDAQLRHQRWAAATRKRIEEEIAARQTTVAGHRLSAAQAQARCQVIDRLRAKRDQPS